MGLPYGYDCIFTGDYYMIRNSASDYNGWANKMYGSYIEFYDTKFNLVHQAYFERYIRNIGYYNGTYYCEEIENGIKTSTDMVKMCIRDRSYPVKRRKAGGNRRRAGRKRVPCFHLP